MVATMPNRNTTADFWKKVNKRGPHPRGRIAPGRCWVWTGGLQKGYGIFCFNNERWRAHRFSFALSNGTIPEGADVHHVCENKKCVRPSHLKAVPPERHSELHDHGSYNTAKTHCINGHEFTEDNTYIRPRGRECRACIRDRQRKRRAEGKS